MSTSPLSSSTDSIRSDAALQQPSLHASTDSHISVENQVEEPSLAGRKIKWESAVPGRQKAIFVFTLFIEIVLVVFVILASRGIIHMPSWAPWGKAALEGTAIGIGCLQGISLLSMVYTYCCAQKRRKQVIRQALEEEDLNVNDTSLQPQNGQNPQNSRRNSNTPALLPPPPAPVQDVWDTRLSNTLKTVKGDPNTPLLSQTYYNLEDPDKEVAEEAAIPGFVQLPAFGKYDPQNPSFNNNSHLMAVRLPNAQLKAFPRGIQAWFQRSIENGSLDANRIECYFLVFNNTEQIVREDGTVNHRRNIAMHTMVFPDYQIFDASMPKAGSNLSANTLLTQGPNRPKSGLAAPMDIAFCEAEGVKMPSELKENRQGAWTYPKNYKESKKCLLLNQGLPTVLNIHPSRTPMPVFSPNTAEICIDSQAEVSSFYIATQFRGKAVIFHALTLNKDQGDGQTLLDAIGTDSVSAFLETLDNNDFIYARQVNRTFTHSSEL